MAQYDIITFQKDLTGRTVETIISPTANTAVYFNGSTTPVAGVLPVSAGGTGSTTAGGSFSAISPLTTKGDLLGYGTDNARLAVGTNNQILLADSSQALGVRWMTPTNATVGLGNVTNDAQVKRTEMGSALGVATLDASGKVISSQMPAIAITDTFVVASQAAMLALVAETGDVAIRTDLSKSFILKGSDPSILANWQELLTPVSAVTSVNGYTGTVVLGKADIGLGNVPNVDATNATNISTGTLTAARLPAFTGDVTTTAGSSATTIANNAVTYAKIQNISATNRLLGRATAGAGVVEELTIGSGLTLTGTTLSATNTNGGTVTSVSVTTSNGVSGTVATASTTPAITLTLGAITPTSVAASGTVTGSNLSGTHAGTSSGTNTGDQTITLTGNVTGTGTGSFATTIANNAVTYAKIQNVSATARILGRATAGAGIIEELTLGTGLAFAGSAISITTSVPLFVTPPVSYTSAGAVGQIAKDSNYLYVYTGDGTTHTWNRTPLAVW